jgi:hypothetical protein
MILSALNFASSSRTIFMLIKLECQKPITRKILSSNNTYSSQTPHVHSSRNFGVRYAMPGATAASSLTHANAVLTHLQRARFCLRYSFLTCLGDSSSLRMPRSKVNIINEYNSRYF